MARRSLHVGLGLIALTVPFLGWKITALLALSFALLNAYALPRIGLTRWLLRPAKTKQQEGRRGLVLYPLCVLALALGFRRDSLGIQVGWLCLAVCDGLAPILAMGLRGPHWPWTLRKRILPSAAAAALASGCMFMLLPIPGLWALSAGFFAMLGESQDTPFDDNITTAAGGAFGYVIARNLL